MKEEEKLSIHQVIASIFSGVLFSCMTMHHIYTNPIKFVFVKVLLIVSIMVWVIPSVTSISYKALHYEKIYKSDGFIIYISEFILSRVQFLGLLIVCLFITDHQMRRFGIALIFIGITFMLFVFQRACIYTKRRRR